MKNHRSVALALTFGALLALAGAGPAQAGVELRTSSTFVAEPGGVVTVSVRATEPGDYPLYQERLNRTGPAPGGVTAGWSCVEHGPNSKPGYLADSVAVGRVWVPTAGQWFSTRISANHLKFNNFSQATVVDEYLRIFQPDAWKGSCIDPVTTFDRIMVLPPGSFTGVGRRLQRVL